MEQGVSRRGVLAGAAALAAGAAATALGGGVASGGGRLDAAGRLVRKGAARNVILAVADGMAAGTLALADYAMRHKAGAAGGTAAMTAWTALSRQTGVRRAVMATDCAGSLVTDSAAASTAWSIGQKVEMGRLCVTPEGAEPKPFLVRAREAGKRVGCVTTTTITHATPAGFYANWPKRDEQAKIGEQLLKRPIDLAMGGGAKHFAKDAVAAVIQERFRPTTAQGLGALNAVSRSFPEGTRVLGLFAEDHLAFSVDRGEKSDEPTLAEMTAFAMTWLAGAEGFVLQIEGGRVDHAAHNNDACAMLHDQLAFDAALAKAIEFTSGRDDTLVIVTTDHATANPGLTLYGRDGARGLTRLIDGRRSFDAFFSELKAAVAAEPKMSASAKAAVLAAAVQRDRQIEIGDDGRAKLTRHFEAVDVQPFRAKNLLECVLGDVLANAYGVAFVSPNHTADHVELLAMGPGSESLPGFIDNTDVCGLMAKAMELVEGK